MPVFVFINNKNCFLYIFIPEKKTKINHVPGILFLELKMTNPGCDLSF